MSQIPGSNLPPESAGANPAMVRRRPASVQLRAGGTGPDVQSLMDPANQSLADALKITYRIIQLAMLGLVVAYAASGFQSVKLTETGVRINLGRAESETLPAGFAMSLPTPMGEVVKIDTSAVSLDMERSFFQALSEENLRKPPSELENFGKMRLDPLADGQNLTGDLGIAHSRWRVQYQRASNKVLEYIRNVNPEDEEKIVNRAVMRGVVFASSAVSIDEFLKAQPDPDRKGPLPLVELAAKEHAQQLLDEMKTGIVITNLDMEARTPPLALRRDFAQVDASKQDARREAEAAEQERSTRLSTTAGDAAPMLLSLISTYDAQLAKEDTSGADATLKLINDMLDGRPVTVDGQVSPRIKGLAATTISDAEQYRSAIVSKAATDAQLYGAKLAIYRGNPRLLVSGEWQTAFSSMMAGNNRPAIWWAPVGQPIDLWLNTDPELAKQREMAALQDRTRKINEREAKDMSKARNNEFLTPTREMKE